MDVMDFAKLVLEQVPYEPTSQQIELIAALARFCSRATPSDSVFLLNGYAGTGKTSLCSALVRALNGVGIGTVLLAPTGRAAKVFSAFAGQQAYTIHRRIYNVGGNGITQSRVVRVAENRSHNTIFIVDEASMIGGDSASSSLLEDLVHYVYSGVNCRLILLGDTAQLPPVGCTESPAMSAKVLHDIGLRVTRVVLTATVRQAKDSGILYNATWLRKAMRQQQLPVPKLTASPFPDVQVVEAYDLEEMLTHSYAEHGVLDTILITRSNRRATEFNMAVRATVLYYEEELRVDEILLIGKNDYFWTKDIKGLDFIANGDMAIVEEVYGTETRYDRRFADVRLRLPDRNVVVECKIMLDTLVSSDASVTSQSMRELFDAVMADTEDAPEKETDSQRVVRAMKSPYFNALQVKYGYAVTCHKAQGGQWSDVYVDLGYIPPEAMGMDFYRWLYTSVTRATKRLYLFNPTVEIR
jgi:exodeoxyribonuclease-5